MLNVFNRNIFKKTHIYNLLFLPLFICNVSNVFADSMHYKHSASNITNSVSIFPNNLKEITYTKLKSLKRELESKSDPLLQTQNALNSSEKKLLNSLFAYDNVRLQIAEVIIDLVEEYNVTGNYKKKLLGYSTTFNSRIKPARNNVRTLDEYKAYDKHFAVAYISLLYTFKENPDFYENYMRDINNLESTIGKYIKQLATAYGELEKSQHEYVSILTAQKNKELIVKIDNEIKIRKARIISKKQY